jgi:signal transduction histidine kinase
MKLQNTIKSNLEESKKMTKLVNDLLLISRGDNQATLHSFTEVDLHTFVKKIITKLSSQAENKGLTLSVTEYKKIALNLDTDNFERAVSNIIHNAIKYTHTGGVSIALQQIGKKVSIIISDTGVGIDQKDLPFVFNRFYKAEHSRNDSSSSGLGLSIAKLIVEEHKGTIRIESEVNKGTIVTIALPLNA